MLRLIIETHDYAVINICQYLNYQKVLLEFAAINSTYYNKRSNRFKK